MLYHLLISFFAIAANKVYRLENKTAQVMTSICTSLSKNTDIQERIYDWTVLSCFHIIFNLYEIL